MTAAELRAIVGEVRHLKRWDTAVPMVRMMDAMFAHADALVELVAACEAMSEYRAKRHELPLIEGRQRRERMENALAAVHAVGEGGK